MLEYSFENTNDVQYVMERFHLFISNFWLYLEFKYNRVVFEYLLYTTKPFKNHEKSI